MKYIYALVAFWAAIYGVVAKVEQSTRVMHNRNNIGNYLKG